MTPLIVSVPHSGTRTLMKAVGCSYAHVFIRENPNWIAGFTEDQYLICPLRDPKKVWKSWVKRWNTGEGAVDLALFELQYRHLEILDKHYELHYVPLMGAGEGSMNASTTTNHPEPDWDYIYKLPMIAKFFDD